MSLYNIICFTDFVPDPQTKYALGFSINGVLAAALAINLGVVLITTVIESSLSIKRWFRNRKLEKV